MINDINKVDLYSTILMNNPEGLSFDEINIILNDSGNGKYVLKNEANLIRASDSKNGGYTHTANRKKRFIHNKIDKTNIFYPNIDYYLNKDLSPVLKYKHLLPQPEKIGDYLDICTEPVFLKMFTSEYMWDNIMKKSLTDLKHISSAFNDVNIEFKNKNISETLSNIIAENFAYQYNELSFFHIEVGPTDQHPDLIITNNFNFEEMKCEIKVAMGDKNGAVGWRGGANCKRYGSYFLVTWFLKEDSIGAFVTYTYLKNNNWVSGHKEYYATGIKIHDLFKLYNPHPIIGKTQLSSQKNIRADYVDYVV